MKRDSLKTNILLETMRIKKKYCTGCKYNVENNCVQNRVVRECWRKKRRNEK